ncbi:PGL/p-HBAD biosynthesis glycosyltransferase/MT3031 [Variovorax sp. PBL-E5]|nr:PGL/p-HBAD biosynthesis glycosyltransferase/MT3031 [Variovorax sp. PBL-E5]
MMSEYKPRLALDMYVLAQGIKTGVYRVCDELFARLAASPRFDVRTLIREGDEDRAAEYIEAKGLRADRAAKPADADILFSPFGVAPRPWLDDAQLLRAHLVYDLIAIHRPDYFTPEASAEVRGIIASLDEETVIFAISEHTREELLAYRPDLRPEQVTVIPLAAGAWFKPCEDRSEKAAVRAKHGIPSDVPYVLSLATLEIRKNLDQVVRAFVRFLELNPTSAMRLVLAGMSGWKLEKLNEALAAAGTWRNRIILTGFVEDAELSPLYSDATCFIYLSRYEGFGLPPLEAMACGTPVICADNSSLPEVVGDAGIAVDADDVEAAAQGIQRIAGSDLFRDELSRKGLRRARLFDWDRCAQIVADTLAAAYARHAAQPSHHEAGFSGYKNGSRGPAFAACGPAVPDRCDGAWPLWRHGLAAPCPPHRTEGGLRMRGQLKRGTPDEPLVSYVTIVRNNAATLARTIESVQLQSYANVEHIVLDGASTDGTLELIKQHADRLDYFASEPDGGLYDALNKVIPLARGQLICVLNSDDWLEPDAAEIAAHRMRAESSQPAMLLSAALVEASDVLHPWPPAFVHPGSYFTCAHDCHNAIYATRAAYERTGPYDASYKIAADFKWIMACLDAGVRFVYSKEATVNYSLGGTSSDTGRHSIECKRVVADRFPCLLPAEVDGLYDCFFSLPGVELGTRSDRTVDHIHFLQALFTKYSDKPELLNAFGWASITTLKHPLDAPTVDTARDESSIARALKDAAKSVLGKYPWLYDAAAGGYRRLKG